MGEDFWYRGKTTRRSDRRLWRGGAIGAAMLVPAPWRAASAPPSPTRSARCSRCRAPAPPAARPRWSDCRWRPTASTRPAASTAGRSRLVIADDESKPDVGRRKTEKMVEEDKIDVHVGGFLSNICLACMPVFEEAKIVNMISVCLDTTLTTTKCNRYSFRVLRLRAGAGGRVRAHAHQQDGQEVAHRLCRLLLGPVDARRLRCRDQEERRRGRRHAPAFRSAPPT